MSGWNLSSMNRVEPEQLLWTRVRGSRPPVYWVKSRAGIPIEIRAERGRKPAWHISIGEQQYRLSLARAARFDISGSADGEIKSGTITIGGQEYRRQPGPISGFEVVDSAGSRVVQDGAPWRDAHLRKGVVRLTSITAEGGDAYLLAALLVCSFSLEVDNLALTAGWLVVDVAAAAIMGMAGA